MIEQFVDLTPAVLNLKTYRGDPFVVEFIIEDGAAYAALDWVAQIRQRPNAPVVSELTVTMVVVGADASVSLSADAPVPVGEYVYDIQASSDGSTADGVTLVRGKVEVEQDVTL